MNSANCFRKGKARKRTHSLLRLYARPIRRKHRNSMAKTKNFSQPVRNGGVELVELARKKVVHAFYYDKMILAGQGWNQSPDLFQGAILVSASVNEELRFLAIPQERKIGTIHGNSQTYQV